MTNKKQITCPHCHQSNTWKNDNPFKPFCSERCKLIDLGEWASEGYRIETDEQPSSSDDEK